MAVHISPVRIQRIKERWEREVLSGLERQERRIARTRQILAHTSDPRGRDRDGGHPEHGLLFRATSRRRGQLELFVTARTSMQIARGTGWVRHWLLFSRHGGRWQQDPEKGVRR